MNKFTVGDIVAVTNPTSEWYGRVGRIVADRSEGNCYYFVSIQGSHEPFAESELAFYVGGGKDVTEPKKDMVNNPAHYGQGSIECIDYIEDFLNEDEYIGYLRGNIAKYLHRWRYKNGLEDLKKAQWYLDRLIKHGEPK